MSEISNAIGRIAMRVAPATVARLIELDRLKTRVATVRAMWRQHGQANFGANAVMLELMYYGLARDFNRKKYWWMRSVHLHPDANQEVSML